MASKEVMDEIFGKIVKCPHCGLKFRDKNNRAIRRAKDLKGIDKTLCFRCATYHSE